MISIGKTEKAIQDRIKKSGAIHITVIDPSDESQYDKDSLKSIESSGTAAIILRPSLGTSPLSISACAATIKKSTTKQLILLPTNVDDLTPNIDAMLYITLLNSRNIYWMVGAQALGAPVAKFMKIETIPTAYVVVEPGGTLSWMGDVKPIPKDADTLAAMHAQGGELFGMRYLYLESGSRKKTNIEPQMIRKIHEKSEITMIVEAYKTEKERIAEFVEAGAKIIVTEPRDDIRDIISSIES